jgi:hypothetical protein
MSIGPQRCAAAAITLMARWSKLVTAIGLKGE